MTIDVQEVRRRLLALLNDDNLVNDYIRQYGPTIDIKHIKAIKEAGSSRHFCGEEEEQGDDPIFEITVTCPVCNKNGITCYELRSKSQQILQNKFLIPVYQGVSGYRTVDYTFVAVTVCPRCLLASPDKKDFIRANPSGGGEIKSQIAGNIAMTLQEKIGERKAILKSVSDYESYFKRPREKEAAIAGYRLAMARAGVEAWYEQPYSLYKLGAYALKIAKIIRDTDGDNREIIQEALGYYEESFRTSNCPSEEIEMQVIYTIVALNLKLGEDKKAHSYLQVFTNLHNARLDEMKKNPKLTTATIQKWNERAKRLWEDRDISNLFESE